MKLLHGIESKLPDWVLIVSGIKFFPLSVLITLALIASTWPQSLWDADASPWAATAVSFVIAPLAAAVSSFDTYRLLKPSWSRLVLQSERGLFMLLWIAIGNAAGFIGALYIGMAASLALSGLLGNAVSLDPAVLLNGTPLVLLGSTIGVCAARWTKTIVIAPVAAVGLYCLMISEVYIGSLEVFVPFGGEGPVSSFTHDRGHIIARSVIALGAVAALVAVCAIGVASRKLQALLVTAAVLLNAGVAMWANIATPVGPRIHDVQTASTECRGNAPTVCLPRGRKAYAANIQKQVAANSHVFEKLGVPMPSMYSMSWPGLNKPTGSVGYIPFNVPNDWNGQFSESLLANMMGTPTVHGECRERAGGGSEVSKVVGWFYDEISPQSETSVVENQAVVPTEDVAKIYRIMHDCQVNK